MLNLQGQRTNDTQPPDEYLQQHLKQAFGTVLADQVMEGKLIEQQERDAQLKRQQQLKNNTNNNDEKQIHPTKASDDEEESSDIDFDDMDRELDQIENQRRNQIAQTSQEIASWKAKGHGEYNIIIQSEFLPTVTETELVVVHFFHRAFERCKIIGQHLVKIAPKYYPVRICSIDAEKAPFFVEKLKITVLPTLVFFKDGKVVDRITGFSELGNHDNFTQHELELRMKKSGIMKQLQCHKDDAERLAADEKRNIDGTTLFRFGTNHGINVDTNNENGDEF